MIVNPEIDYSNPKQVVALLMKIEDAVIQTGMKKSKIAAEVGENNATYSKLISAVDGYVSEERIRKYCNYLNERFE